MRLKIYLYNFFAVVLFSLNSIAFSQTNEENVISKKIVLNANKTQVWSALTSDDELSKWWNKGVKLKPFVGGEFYEPWGDNQLATGEVKNIKTESYIEFTWKEKYWQAEQRTICRFTIKKDQKNTILSVTHSGWETFKNLKNRQKLIRGFNKGWDSLLPKLKGYLDSNI